jgi:hypothetical protein
VAAPKAFVSYSYDSPEHKAWVLKLAMDLRSNGVDVTLDQWDLKPGQDMAAFMADGVAKSDRVLLICSENYVRRAEKGSGGVGYERLVITSELVSDIDTRKFLPVIRNSSARRLPHFLGPRLYVDFTADAEYSVKLEEILRDLHAAPALEKPPLGQNPFSSTPSAETPTRAGSAPLGVEEQNRLCGGGHGDGHGSRILSCARRDSNSHCAVLEAAVSASWTTCASGRAPDRDRTGLSR